MSIQLLLLTFAHDCDVQVSLGLSWPALVLDIIGWLRSVLVLDLSATSPECSVRMDYLSKYAFFLLFPVLLVAAMCTIGRLKKCCVSRTRLASGPTDAELEMLRGGDIRGGRGCLSPISLREILGAAWFRAWR